MKSFKYLLVLPFAITALASCNKGNFSPTDFKNAKAMVDNYAKSIKNSKASSITVGGHINEIKLKGDATWWSFTEPEEPESRVVPVPLKSGAVQANPLGKAKKKDILGLLSMIPNFSVKDSEIIVDSQDIVSFTLPGSLMSLGDSAISGRGDSAKLGFLVIANLPKFPMNNNLLRTIRGLKHLPEEMTAEAWEAVEDDPWKEDIAKVNFYTSGGRLKITLETDDIESFFNEVASRYMSGGNSYNADPEPTKKKYPGSFSITTNKIGYIDSFSAKFEVKGTEYEPVESKDADIFYLHLKGDVSVDIGLTFKQTISTPITLKYQLSAYHKTGSDETPDLEYPIVKDGEKTNVLLTYDKDKSKPLTTTLDDFKDYLTFDWYKNVSDPNTDVNPDPGKPGELKAIYDDPIFCCDYWNDNAKNIAFTNEMYDILAIPQSNVAILGGRFHEFGVAPEVNSRISTSINGRVVSENGLLTAGQKVLNAAGDAVQYVNVKKDDKDNILLADEIFINSTLLNAESSEYIVNIAIAVL